MCTGGIRLGILTEILVKVLPIILAIVLGMVLRKFHFFREGTVEDLKKVVVNISLPTLLFTAFAQTQFEARYLLIIGLVFMLCVLMLLMGFAAKKALKSSNRYLPALFCGFEAGMMGYAIFTAVYGAENTYQFAVIDLGQVIFVFFVLVTVLQRFNGTKASASDTVLSFVKTPVIIAIFAGILFSVTGLFRLASAYQAPMAIYETIKLLSSVNIPLICLIIGYELKLDIKALPRSVVIVLSRMLISLGLAAAINQFVLISLLHLDRGFQAALFAMFLMPSPFVIPVYMKSNEESEKQEVLNILSVHIVLSLIAFIILVGVFQ